MALFNTDKRWKGNVPLGAQYLLDMYNSCLHKQLVLNFSSVGKHQNFRKKTFHLPLQSSDIYKNGTVIYKRGY
jgi:hypothetical protein